MDAVEQIAEETATAVDVAPAELSVMGVAPAAIAAVWPHILPMIEAARAAVPDLIAEREWPEDIRDKAERGMYQIWLVYEGSEMVAVAVSSVEQFTRVTACVIQYLAGRGVDDWLQAWVDEIGEWARDAGCTQIECRGRLGWGKKLKPLGAEIAGAAYVMKVA